MPVLPIEALPAPQECFTSLKCPPSPHLCLFISKNTSNPEVPYFISKNTSVSSSKTFHFQMCNNFSLEIVHFQKCFISSSLESKPRKALFLLQKMPSPLSTSVPISSPKMPYFIFRNVPPPEMLPILSLELNLFRLQKYRALFLKHSFCL